MTAPTIKEMPRPRTQACRAILRALPDWFGIEAYVESYAHDAEVYPTFGAYDVSGALVGFITVRRDSDEAFEVHVLGVAPEHHGQGIGKVLIARAREHAREMGCHALTVKTLGPSKPDPHYDRTREFYLRCGFQPVDERFDIWPENPFLIMRMSLRER